MTNPTGYVYIYGGNGLYKIGRAKNVEKRLRSFPKPPFAAALIRAIPTEKPALLERCLHQRFQAQRSNGEWFRLGDDDIEFLRTASMDDFLPEPEAKGTQQQRVEMVINLKSYLRRIESEELAKPVSQQKPVPTLKELAAAVGVHEVTMARIVNNDIKQFTLDVGARIIREMRRRGFTMDVQDLFAYREELG